MCKLTIPCRLLHRVFSYCAGGSHSGSSATAYETEFYKITLTTRACNDFVSSVFFILYTEKYRYILCTSSRGDCTYNIDSQKGCFSLVERLIPVCEHSLSTHSFVQMRSRSSLGALSTEIIHVQ